MNKDKEEEGVKSNLQECMEDLVDISAKRFQYLERGVWLACAASLAVLAPRGKELDTDALHRYLAGEEGHTVNLYKDKEES